jgi:hypothetical protein
LTLRATGTAASLWRRSFVAQRIDNAVRMTVPVPRAFDPHTLLALTHFPGAWIHLS